MGKLQSTWPYVPHVDAPIAEPLFQRLGRPIGRRPRAPGALGDRSFSVATG
jgi:hypothetical protein